MGSSFAADASAATGWLAAGCGGGVALATCNSQLQWPALVRNCSSCPLKRKTSPVCGIITLCPVNCCSTRMRSEEHTSELQSRLHLVCRLLLEKKKIKINIHTSTKDLTMQQTKTIIV